MKKFILSIILTITLIASPACAEFFRDVIVTSPNGIWTDSRAYTTLNAAVAVVGADERTIKIVSPQTVTALTVPANVTLSFERDGAINNSGQLTIETNNIEASNRQIFTGTGDVDFASGSIVKSGWFTNLDTALEKTNDDTLTMIISKTETTTANMVVGDDVTLKWESPYIITSALGHTVSNIKNIEAGDFQIFAGAGDFDFLDGSELKLNWFNQLSSVLTWVEDEEVTIIVNEDSIVQAGVTTLSNESIRVVRGGRLNIDAGVVFTINGPFDAGLYQVFSGDGSVSFGTGVTNVIYAEWYGAINDSANVGGASAIAANTKAFQQACLNQGVLVTCGIKTFYFDDQISIHRGTTLDLTYSIIHFHIDAANYGAGFQMGNNTTIRNAQKIFYRTANTESGATQGIIGVGLFYPAGEVYSNPAPESFRSVDNILIENIIIDGAETVLGVSNVVPINLTNTVKNVIIRNIRGYGDGLLTSLIRSEGSQDTGIAEYQFSRNIIVQNIYAEDFLAHREDAVVALRGGNISIENVFADGCAQVVALTGADVEYTGSRGVSGNNRTISNVIAINSKFFNVFGPLSVISVSTGLNDGTNIYNPCNSIINNVYVRATTPIAAGDTGEFIGILVGNQTWVADQSPHNVIISNADISDCSYGIYASNVSSLKINNSKIHRNRNSGISGGGDNIHIESCEVYMNNIDSDSINYNSRYGNGIRMRGNDFVIRDCVFGSSDIALGAETQLSHIYIETYYGNCERGVIENNVFKGYKHITNSRDIYCYLYPKRIIAKNNYSTVRPLVTSYLGYTIAPTTTIWNIGDTVLDKTPVSGATQGWVCIGRNDTEMRIQAVATNTIMEVDSTTGMAVADVISVTLDNDSSHWTTISAITDADTLVLTAGIPAGRTANVDAAVRTNDWTVLPNYP